MFGYRTVREGERVAVWDYRGRVEIVDGPRRLLLYRQTVQPLGRFTAAADQYLVVDFRDGHSEHVRGPAAVWFDPVNHQEIRTEAALPVDSNEAIVVYRRAGEKVDRRVVRGPAMFVPTEDEWLHAFRWHGADPRDARRKIPEALKFVKLRVIPDQMYFDVESVRTADDALLVVKLMVFFELADIETMLDQTHDPIADFINAVTADVIAFVGAATFEEFKQKTGRLNDLATYANLVRRAERIGYAINKVVYRGYAAGDKLQVMHDNAIETRTGLKLEAETEEQAQALADLKLEREAERAAKQRELARLQAEHKIGLERLAHEEALRSRAADQEQEARAHREMNAVEVEHMRAADGQRAEFFKTLQGMQVDLTRYLVAQYQNPDRLIRIDGDNKTQLHLHGN
jgi:hypothetical protein